MWCTSGVLWRVFIVAALGTQAHTQFSRNESPNNLDTTHTSLCHVVDDQQGESHIQVVCKGLNSMQELTIHLTMEQLPLITTLTIASSNIIRLTLDDFIDLPSLHTLMFNHSYISDWKTPQLTSHPNVTVLVLDHCWDTSIVQIIGGKPTLTLTSEMLSSIPLLEELHIVDCYLDHLGRLDDVKQLHKLNIVGGGLGCEEDKLWMLEWVAIGRATISNTTTCYVPSLSMNVMETRYSFNKHPFWMCMNYHKNTQRDCMSPCKCVVTGIKDKSFPIIHVSCSVAGLTQLPQIPRYTTCLNLTRNNISDMSMLFTHEHYRHIDLVLLDHNRIGHMDGQLFYGYVKNRSLDLGISLSHNTLSTMPVKEMRRLYNEAVQEGELHLPLFDLGNNPWNCDDCEFLLEFQALLYYQSIKVTSLIDIRCSDWSAHHSGQQIITLDIKSQCALKPPLLQPIDILNICMGILLLLIILNFLHNFVQYRRHGNLPWIITKLPCC